MKYEQRLRLSKSKYIAVLDGALVIVTTNRRGEPIRYAIFEKKEKTDEGF